jgi:hypothetical protein
LQALIKYSDLALICLQEIHLHPSRALILSGFTAHRYDHLDRERSVEGQLSRSRTASTVHRYIYIYIALAIPVSSANLTNLIAQLPPPLILLEDFNAKNFL